ncbi:MAG: hypothetical protein J6D08_06430 [Lachnospiraceae bacterium]|nr:hypothetical protein [Lachnospiraceae bacterium]
MRRRLLINLIKNREGKSRRLGVNVKNSKIKVIVSIMICAQLMTGCGAGNTQQTIQQNTGENAQTREEQAESGQTAETQEEQAESGQTEEIQEMQSQTEQAVSDKVATADEMASAQENDWETLTPVYVDSLKEGTYSVVVDSSSSMFKIPACELTVENGEMTAVMTMSGTGYLYLYMGTGAEAVEAAEEDYISFAEDNGVHTFTVPVEALDQPINCVAYSKKKEKWYDRQLVFRSDSLPQEALGEGTLVTAESLGLEDGTYTVEVALEGGSGKASVESPCTITVKNQKVTATIIWGSSNYDYMLVDGEKYEMLPVEGNSTFEIPVAGFDWKLAVVADTVAMSTPHEIDYTLYFDSATLQKVSES